MADYIISNEFKTMEEIWDDLLRLHWDYLDTEENMEKLKMRRKLEDELKDFLSIVQHDRKFFLTETAHVFKQSVLRLDQFSAYKALMGFEAISQYANNLFRKPWRKEYRCIKLYSGYYQHEVKANLIDAEKMFEAMGYTLLPNHTLILEGPICPDQVTNVSRDAVIAYCECQIMKQIFQGLIAMQLQTTWQEIFEFRETHIGSASQAIKSMAYAIEKRRQRKERQYESSYSNLAPTPPPPPPIYATSSSHNQIALCNNQRHLLPSQSTISKGACSAFYTPSSNSSCSNNCGALKSIYSNQLAHHSSIPHSKSLDHYNNEPTKLMEHHNVSRHSFDQPFSSNYKNYDCTDGIHAAAVAADRSSHSSGMGVYHQPSCSLQNTGNIYETYTMVNRYPLPAFPDHHYSQIGGTIERGEHFVDTNMGTCCHQNSHYECLSNFNSRSLMQKSKNGADYSNCNFQSK
ncbi:protein tamozhennic isoform X1 [Sitodiplosis mosellana]|uniref:protein tamozhennic isoform X1 n=1 Tax=Sitodiplosis mosellana TaxID=263140 RepID=UPI0024437A67|nr:protein tamozhennic isoform X1 [Sitodiplosis mosellana]XP_055302744.1 protein tamozhennic isoform X1 [Sitodiplosis mosellana]XP_055302745.1 protein tamozhennic isoform X1 [Sitodiplosis mosellana]